MKKNILTIAVLLAAGLLIEAALATTLPDGYWSLQQASEILDKTRRVMLDPDLSTLSEAEKAAAARLIQAGKIINGLYEDSMHPDALTSLQSLQALDQGDENSKALLDLYYLFRGPIATTLDNERVPFLPVTDEQPGKNMYPQGMRTENLDPFLQSRPDLAADLLAVRTVVRESNKRNLQRDLGMLDRFPVLDGLHPGLRQQLQAIHSGADDSPWYALPYSVRWAPEVMQMNYFLQKGLLSFDPANARLTIHYDRYQPVASRLLEEVLVIQSAGSSERARQFIEKYTAWETELHERLAQRLREASRYRFRMVRYKALQ